MSYESQPSPRSATRRMRALGLASHPDRKVLLKRLRLEHDLVEGDELTVEGWRIGCPQLDHRIDVFIGHSAPGCERNAEGAELPLGPARQRHDDEASAREMIERCKRLGQLDRPVIRNDHEARDLDRPCRSEDEPRRRERVHPERTASGNERRMHDDVLGNHDVVVAEPIELLCCSDLLLETDRSPPMRSGSRMQRQSGEIDDDFHPMLLCS